MQPSEIMKQRAEEKSFLFSFSPLLAVVDEKFCVDMTEQEKKAKESESSSDIFHVNIQVVLVIYSFYPHSLLLFV